jgi:hypothetical protein
MRQRGKTIRPRQRHPQQEETHADRDAPLPSVRDVLARPVVLIEKNRILSL